MADALGYLHQQLQAEQEKEQRALMVQLVCEFSQRFFESHQLRISFTDGATRALVAEATAQARSIRDLCAERFRDFQFGLKLISQNTGQTEFVIDEEMVAAPDKKLSEWVVASYRTEPTPAPR